ncbi:MAG: SurA N-terminal domain-containing protein [Candidatus Marinamargulisbacteria bacterium]
MLSFFRNNSVKIVYGIIITFVVTTFLGVVFFNESFRTSKDLQKEQLDRQNAIATLGPLSITNQMYQLELQRLQASIPKEITITEQLVEQIQLQALSSAIQNRLLLSLGKKQKTKASRSEVDAAMINVYEQFDVNNKGDLKQVIRQAGGSYENLVNQIKDDIIAAKTKQAIQQMAVISENDRLYFGKLFEVKEIFISNISTNNAKLDDNLVLQTANNIRDSIVDSDSFDAAFLKQNPSFKDAPSYQKILINQTFPEVSRSIYSLSAPEISQPIKSIAGYHIIELKSVEELPPSQHITEQQLQQDWGNAYLYSYLTREQSGAELRVVNPLLNAIKLKAEGNIEGAIQAYQGAISQDSASPFPNLYIAELQLRKGDVPAAKQSLLKAEIKQGLLSDSVLAPKIHILLASIYNQEKFPKKRDAQYDKLIRNNPSISVLKYLETILEKSNDKNRLSKVTKLIAEKTATEAVKIESDIKLSNEEKTSLDQPLEFN